MTKYTIQAVLTATILIAGAFAFMPVDQASTVHTTVLAGNVGLKCVVETFTLPATFDNDVLTLTFTNEGVNIFLTSITGDLTTAANGANTDMGFSSTTIDGSITNWVLADDNANGAISPTELEFLGGAATGVGGYYVQSAIVWTIDDDAGTATAVNDVLSLEICGYVSDPANFTNADTAITNAPAA